MLPWTQIVPYLMNNNNSVWQEYFTSHIYLGCTLFGSKHITGINKKNVLKQKWQELKSRIVRESPKNYDLVENQGDYHD